MSKITAIKRVLAPGYASGIATGITILGPTGDGYVHLEFVRDVEMTMEEPMGGCISEWHQQDLASSKIKSC
jgi:hypothetical protein